MMVNINTLYNFIIFIILALVKESENQVLSVPCGSICKYNQNLQSLAPV